MRQAHRVLIPGGSLTLTTDDERHCASVVHHLVAGEDALCARWQPAFVAPHYKEFTHGTRGYRSAFDELWAARGFSRRFQCRFTTRRLKAPQRIVAESQPPPLQADGRAPATTAAETAPTSPSPGPSGGGKRKRGAKETSKQRKKRRAKEKAALCPAATI